MVCTQVFVAVGCGALSLSPGGFPAGSLRKGGCADPRAALSTGIFEPASRQVARSAWGTWGCDAAASTLEL